MKMFVFQPPIKRSKMFRSCASCRSHDTDVGCYIYSKNGFTIAEIYGWALELLSSPALHARCAKKSGIVKPTKAKEVIFRAENWSPKDVREWWEDSE